MYAVVEENVEALCPNCHSLTINFGGANLGNGRNQRRAKRGEACAKGAMDAGSARVVGSIPILSTKGLARQRRSFDF